MKTRSNDLRKVVSEAVGSFLLVTTIVGSGIMGDRLSNGNAAMALLANSLATGAMLVTIIFTFAPISSAHFNPLVTLAAALERSLAWHQVPRYIAAQILGAMAGVVVAHAMFALPMLEQGTRDRHGLGQLLSEAVATFGLLVVVHGTGKRPSVVPLTVGAYIAAAYWFTASTSFANPAVTLARAFTNTFSGIRPTNVPGFIAAECIGGLAATLLFRWLLQTNQTGDDA